MAEGKLTPSGSPPAPAQSAWYAEERRHQRELVSIIDKWPEWRMHWAYAILGSAIAVADSFGIDVEAFLSELRKREPKPAVLQPPTERRS